MFFWKDYFNNYIFDIKTIKQNGKEEGHRMQNITELLVVEIGLFLIKKVCHFYKSFREEAEMDAWDFLGACCRRHSVKCAYV